MKAAGITMGVAAVQVASFLIGGHGIGHYLATALDLRDCIGALVGIGVACYRFRRGARRH
jgi:hypothetical protein